jgi:hypothetical protein
MNRLLRRRPYPVHVPIAEANALCGTSRNDFFRRHVAWQASHCWLGFSGALGLIHPAALS